MLRSNHRYISGHSPATISDTHFEFTESDIWNTSTSPDFQPTPIIPITKPSKPSKHSKPTPSSLPVNVPDWSKILKKDCGQKNPRWVDEFDEFEFGFDSGVDSGAGGRTPPHEVVARTRVVSFSVHEGVGRTLKGRDLSRVRNAVWEKIGFQD